MKKIKNKVSIKEYSKGLVCKDNDDLLNEIILCLANLESFKVLLSDRFNLNKIINEDSIIIKYFFKIIHYLWNSNDNDEDDENEYNNLYNNFKKEIMDLTLNNSNYTNMKKLIEFIILKLHNEFINKKNEMNFGDSYDNEKELHDIFYANNTSLIQQLFFFDLILSYQCKCGNIIKYYPDCSLEIKIQYNIIENISKDNNNTINIYHIFNFLKDDLTTCGTCNNQIHVKRTFFRFPKYLIIIISKDNNFNYNFKIDDIINIREYYYNFSKLLMFFNNIKYELVSFIYDKSIIYCKSPINNKWYKYEGKNIKEIVNFNEEMKIPELLIYKKDNLNKY